MGIKINNKDVGSILYNNRPVIFIYINGEKIWPIDISPIIDGLLSCFYNGYWADEYPWTDDTPWTD